jgi:hypothetical protein
MTALPQGNGGPEENPPNEKIAGYLLRPGKREVKKDSQKDLGTRYQNQNQGEDEDAPLNQAVDQSH